MKQPPAPNTSDSDQPQPRIPSHRLLKRIGKGGMGEVWLAEEIARHELQAVKFVFQRTVDDAPKFGREVEGVRLFEPLSREHDVFVDILHVGLLPNGEGFYYAMELADNASGPPVASDDFQSEASADAESGPAVDWDGDKIAAYSPRTLLSELQRRGRLPPMEVLEIGIRLANALAILHDIKPRPLIHRDIKPANILFVQSQPRLGDPGLVVWEKDAPSCLGTAGFTPHEGPGKPEADVYSLGMTLYCALTGFPPERFPELPRDSLPVEQKVVWQRLNSIICRACDLDPRNRYRNGRGMLDDLLRVRAGRKPALAPRVKHAVRNAVAVGALVVAAVALTVFFNANRKGAPVMKPDYRAIRTLFEDEFEGNEIDRTMWQWSTTNRCATDEPTMALPQPFIANGSLMLEASAKPAGGKECWQCIWLDSLVDIKSSPETLVEIEFGACATNASPVISIGPCDGPVGRSYSGARWLWHDSGTMNQPLDLPRTTVCIELSTNSGLATVWFKPTSESDSSKSGLKLFDLSGLESWKLRFVAQAVSSAEMVPDTTRFWLYRVQATEVKRAPRIAGWITNLTARLPVGGVKVRNRTAGAEAVANDDGMYVLSAKPGPNKLEVIAAKYDALSNLVVNVPRGRSVRVDIPVEKTLREFGDVIETRWTLPEQSERVAIGERHLFYYGTNQIIKRVSFDASNAEPLVRLPSVGMAWANGSLYAVETHLNAFLYRIDENGGLTVGPRLLTQWPAGLTFDGTNFWYIEFTNLHGSRCSLYAMAPTGEERAHFVSGISDLRSVAAGRGRLWLLAPGRRAYEVVIPPGVTSGQLDDYIMRDFPTRGVCLVYAMDQLWVLGMDKRSVQRVWLGD